MFFLCTGCDFGISMFSMFCALAFAAVTASAQYFSLLSMTVGSMSLGVLFTYLGMLIPTLFGIIVYKQSITVLQVIGLVLMVATLFLGTGIKRVRK